VLGEEFVEVFEKWVAGRAVDHDPVPVLLSVPTQTMLTPVLRAARARQ